MKVIKLETKKFSDSIFSMKKISKKTIEEHLKLYQGYINKYNEIQEKLAAINDEDLSKANQIFSNIRELKVEMSFAWGGVINHEIYFSHLGGNGGTANSRAPDGALLKQINQDFGSFDAFKKDLKATGLSARGWVFTGWNKREGRLFNYLSDSQNTYMMWGVRPVLALDTYEHAYFADFGVNRAGYIDAFLDNLDWKKIEDRFEKIHSCCQGQCKSHSGQ